MTLAKLHTLADTCVYDFAGARLLADHDGFLGTGADLSPSTLLHAYRCGVFPWFNEGDPICWWSPAVRCVITPDAFVPKKSLVRTAKKHAWHIRTNHAFAEVMAACSAPRKSGNDTWITQQMRTAYEQLHQLGAAVSVEVWENDTLIGGLYGIHIGALFCGESMFHKRTDASKIAFWALTALAKQAGIALIDCQLENPHLLSLGAQTISRANFINRLDTLINTPTDSLDDKQLSSLQLLSYL